LGGDMRHVEFPNKDLVRARDIAAAGVLDSFENVAGKIAPGTRFVLQFAHTDNFRQRVCEVFGLGAVMGRVQPESQGPRERKDDVVHGGSKVGLVVAVPAF